MKRLLLVCLLLVCIGSVHAFSILNPISLPSGYSLIDASKMNVRLYQKNGSETYVQLLDIAGGATVRINNPGISYRTGQDPTFTRYSLETHWNYAQGYANMYSMVNGQFFNYTLNPLTSIQLAFGVRTNNSVLTNGYDSCCQRRILKVYGGNGGIKGVIVENQTLSMSSYTVPTAIVGLSPSENRSSVESVGRLYMCATGVNTSPRPWLVVFSTKTMTQPSVIIEMRKFGCSDLSTIMMDGSGSSQLKTITGITMYGNGFPTARNLPQVMVFTYW